MERWCQDGVINHQMRTIYCKPEMQIDHFIKAVIEISGREFLSMALLMQHTRYYIVQRDLQLVPILILLYCMLAQLAEHLREQLCDLV